MTILSTTPAFNFSSRLPMDTRDFVSVRAYCRPIRGLGGGEISDQPGSGLALASRRGCGDSDAEAVGRGTPAGDHAFGGVRQGHGDFVVVARRHSALAASRGGDGSAKRVLATVRV